MWHKCTKWSKWYIFVSLGGSLCIEQNKINGTSVQKTSSENRMSPDVRNVRGLCTVMYRKSDTMSDCTLLCTVVPRTFLKVWLRDWCRLCTMYDCYLCTIVPRTPRTFLKSGCETAVPPYHRTTVSPYHRTIVPTYKTCDAYYKILMHVL